MDIERSVALIRANPAEFILLQEQLNEAVHGNGDLIDTTQALLDFLGPLPPKSHDHLR
jgi:hypothetical protein